MPQSEALGTTQLNAFNHLISGLLMPMCSFWMSNSETSHITGQLEMLLREAAT